MNLVQQRLAALLAQGKSQNWIAKESRIAVSNVHNALRGKTAAHPRLLKYLGLKRHVLYIPDWSTKADLERFDGIALDAAPVTLAACIPAVVVAPAAPATAADPLAPIDHESPKLTVERINTATRHGLRAGDAWRDFLAQLPPGKDVDSYWLLYCQTHGTQQDLDPVAIDSLGAPGELYSHLKPVDRGHDFVGSQGIAVQGQRAVGTVLVNGQPSIGRTDFEFK